MEDSGGDWRQLRQGDVVAISALPVLASGVAELLPTPQGVVLLSQTCDVVQSSKRTVTVAPLLPDPTKDQISQAKRGRSPALLYLPQTVEHPERIADMSRICSVPKTEVLSTSPLSRHAIDGFGPQSRQLARRIGRVYSRFAFPDAVHDSLSGFIDAARSKAFGGGHFARVLGLVEEFRVAADHWDRPGRRLKFYSVVPSRFLPPDEDFGAALADEPIPGLGRGEDLGVASVDRVSQLLAEACEQIEEGKGSEGVALRLWQTWCTAVQRQYLDPKVGEEIAAFEFEPVGTGELSYEQMKATEPLDLETLSDSTFVSDTKSGAGTA